ncbi:MAG TPA: hypothetical protein VHE61_22535 [Opitutaceae bacterium]|nr:hypothetical protein [Opitutaceae bacterium]
MLYARRLLRQLIELATKTIYAEEFDFHDLVGKLARNQQGVTLLRAYVAIQCSARLTAALTREDVGDAIATVDAGARHSKWPVFTEILDVHRELAEHYLSLRHLAILRGKLAHKNDEYSYEGAKYSLEHATGGPVSPARLSKLAKVCSEMSSLSRQIEKAELKALEKQDEQGFRRYEEELSARDLRDESDAIESQTIEAESKKVILMLEAKLNRLVRNQN